MKLGRALVCFAAGLVVNGGLFLAGIAGSVMASSFPIVFVCLATGTVSVTSGLTALMLYWKGEYNQ